jgi:Protein of unknown function (DUF1573)
MKATLFALAALAAGVAAAIGWTHQEFAHEVLPVDVALPGGSRTGGKIGPKVVVVNGERHDFGSMDRNSHGSHSYIIRNDGDAPLTLEAGQPSCAICIKVFSVDKEILQPGERTEVRIEWDAKTSDVEFEQSGPLKTNDPNHTSVHLSIRGHVIDTVRTDRGDVHFHDLLQTDTTSSSVNIYAFRDVDLQIEGQDIDHPDIAKFLKISYSPLTSEDLAREPKAKGGQKMQIEVQPGLPYGDFEATINVRTNQNTDPLKVRVIGNIASDLLLMGLNVVREKSLVGLGAIKQSDGKKHTIYLIVKGPHRDDTKVEIASIEPTREFSAKLGEPIRDSAKTVRYPIVIEVPPGATPVTRSEGSYAHIHLATTHPDVKELDIKVRYVVKE